MAALLTAAAAHAQQPDPLLPTLTFASSCFTEQQHIDFTGAGYTPGGEVDLNFGRRGVAALGGFDAHADGAGQLNGFTTIPDADQLLDPTQERETIRVTASDRTRIDAGQAPVESQFATATFTFTRLESFAPARYVVGKRATVEAYGWAFAAGKQAWLVFRRGSRTAATVAIGRLKGACGDRRATITVPRNLKAGRYRVYVTIDTRLHGAYSWRSARVVSR
jgi:hypothetical protein